MPVTQTVLNNKIDELQDKLRNEFEIKMEAKDAEIAKLKTRIDSLTETCGSLTRTCGDLTTRLLKIEEASDDLKTCNNHLTDETTKLGIWSD